CARRLSCSRAPAPAARGVVLLAAAAAPVVPRPLYEEKRGDSRPAREGGTRARRCFPTTARRPALLRRSELPPSAPEVPDKAPEPTRPQLPLMPHDGEVAGRRRRWPRLLQL